MFDAIAGIDTGPWYSSISFAFSTWGTVSLDSSFVSFFHSYALTNCSRATLPFNFLRRELDWLRDCFLDLVAFVQFDRCFLYPRRARFLFFRETRLWPWTTLV